MTEAKKSDPKEPERPVEPEIDAMTFIGGNASLAVPMAGLLVSEPDLSGETLPASQWHKHLSDYLKSPRA